ncbi:SDR family oxidoreductase [Gluconacetobacter tumulicola]
MQELAERLRSARNIDVVVEVSDLSVAGGAAQLISNLDARGLAPDTLVANAAFGINEAFASHDPTRLVAMLQLNVISLTELAQVYASRMKAAGRGHIMLVASIAAFQPTPIIAAYGATKAFVLSLGEAMHVELAPQVGVTVLCPGFMETGFGAVAGFHPSDAVRRIALAPATVARIGVDAMLSGKPSVVAGGANKIMVLATRLIPRVVAARIAYKMGDSSGHAT